MSDIDFIANFFPLGSGNVRFCFMENATKSKKRARRRLTTTKRRPAQPLQNICAVAGDMTRKNHSGNVRFCFMKKAKQKQQKRARRRQTTTKRRPTQPLQNICAVAGDTTRKNHSAVKTYLIGSTSARRENIKLQPGLRRALLDFWVQILVRPSLLAPSRAQLGFRPFRVWRRAGRGRGPSCKKG